MRRQFSWMLALSLVTSPAMTYGADTTGSVTKPELNLKNVELTPAGSLEGQVLAITGKPLQDVQIVVRAQKDVSDVGQKVVTDRNGRFLVTGLKTGTCVMEANGETFAVRVWDNGVAPPTSLESIALIHGADDTVRGNWQDNGLINRIRCMTPQQKCCLALLVGAAIAIPLALDDDGS